jgi:hypothetical protein
MKRGGVSLAFGGPSLSLLDATLLGYVLATACGSDAKPAPDAAISADACGDCDGAADIGAADIGAADIGAGGSAPDVIPACTALAPSDGGGVGGDSNATCPGGWCLVSGTTTSSGPHLRGVWGTGPDDAWAVGVGGLILHWDGATWSETASGTAGDLHAVWAASTSDAWAVGGGGVILHWNGAAWTTVVQVGNGPGFNAVWGAGSGDVWAVGDAGTAMHWDGGAWSAIATGTAESLTSVSGSGTADVWAAAPLGILHWNGKSWSEDRGPVAFPGDAIWTGSPNEAWDVGGTRALHWDGMTWTVPTFGGGDLFNGIYFGVWGSGPADVWAVGGGGVISHSTGLDWTFSTSGTGVDLRAVWGSGPGDVWAVGDGAILRWNGAVWSIVVGGPAAPLTTQSLLRVWGTGPDDVWTVGSGNTQFGVPSAVLHWNGTAWSVVTSAAQVPVLASGWSTSSSDIWFVGAAVGGGGGVVRLNGPSGTPLALGAPLSSTNLSDVWGSGPDDVWVVGGNPNGPLGEGGSILHWDGSSWSVPPVSFAIAIYYAPFLTTIWGSGRDDVWAAGGGWLLHWDGATWSRVQIPGVAMITRVWGSRPNDVWAVGFDSVMHWNGIAWTLTCRPPSPFRVVAGSGPNDVWFTTDASGYHGNLTTTLHWDGTHFTSSVLRFGLHDLWVSGPGDVWGVGATGTIVHRSAP